MTDMLRSIYDHFPYPFRVMAASTRGYMYRIRRYSSRTEELVTEVLSRDKWSAQQWSQWTGEQLERLLDHAATQVPFYRNQWIARRRLGDRATWCYLENWPILEKEYIRKSPLGFVADNCNMRNMAIEHTSGTSGKPLTLWRSKLTEQVWYAQFEARVRRWNAVSRHDRWGIIGGQLVVPVKQISPPFWVWNAGLNQLYLSAQHISANSCVSYLNAIKTHQLVYLLGYPSALSALAAFLLNRKLSVSGLKVIFTNAEMLLKYQRAQIETAFQCKVIDTYGMSELAAAGSECEHGTMHQWPDTGIVEVLEIESSTPVSNGNRGRLVCTGLINWDMPLIRYQVGDSAIPRDSYDVCNCGRTLPALSTIDGRLDDMIITPDGRVIGRLDPVFKSELDIREAQIIQKELDLICVKIVPGPGFNEKTETLIAEQLKNRLGKVRVTFEKVPFIPREPNGKFKAVVCNLPKGDLKK